MIFESLFLKNIFSKNWNSSSELITYLEKHKFIKIGQGWYSVVYTRPESKFVIKINSGDFDYGYVYFVDICKTHVDNENFINIIKYKEYSLYNPFIFTLLPKLKEYNGTEELEDIFVLRNMLSFYKNGEADDIVYSRFSYLNPKIISAYDILKNINSSLYKFDICMKNVLIDNAGNWVLSDILHKIKK